MDEATTELLSRHLDGDLSPDEERAFEARLDADPALAARLAGMRRIKASVAALAVEDRPPARLGDVIDPLLREKPLPLTTRPLARWLAAAAVVVLGLTAIVEINRRSPSGPNVSSIGKAAENRQDSRERFRLAPLPTSSLSPEEQPLGSSERLLASPVPEIELDDPPALDVRGPLEKDSAIARPEARRSTVEDDAKAEEKKAEARQKSLRDEAGTWAAAPPTGRAQLFIFVGEESAWRDFSPARACKAGRYSVRVVVSGGTVREARPVGGAASVSPSQPLCAADIIIGLEVGDVEDGRYSAEIVIQPRAGS